MDAIARTFNGTTQYIRTAIGGYTGNTHPFGTMMAIARRAGTGSCQMIGGSAGTATDPNLGFTSGDQLLIQVGNGGSSSNTTTTFTSTTTWYLFAVTKATGNVTPRFHWYDYTAGTWTHQAGSATQNNSSQVLTSFDIGRWADGTDWFNGTIAVAGMFRTVTPTDAYFDSSALPFSLQAWYALGAQADLRTLWVFDQNATTDSLLDRMGGGANQASGTVPTIATLSVPGFGYGAPIITVGAAAGAGTAAVGSASVAVTAYGLTVSPGVNLGTATAAVTAYGPTNPYTTTFAGVTIAAANTLTNPFTTATVATSVVATAYPLTNPFTTATAATVGVTAYGLTAQVQISATAAAATVTVTTSDVTGPARVPIVGSVGVTAYGLTTQVPVSATAQAAAVSVAAFGLTAQSGATTAAAAVSVSAGGETGPARSSTAAASSVSAFGLVAQVSFSATLSAGTATATGFDETGPARTTTAATASTAAFNLVAQVPGSATIAAASVGVTAYGLTSSAPLSSTAQAATVAAAATNLIAQDAVVPAAATVAVAAFNPTALTPGSATAAAATVGVTAFNMVAQSLVSGVANAAIVSVAASSLTRNSESDASVTVTTAASPLAGTRTPAAASVAVTANDLHFTASTALATTTSVPLVASPLGTTHTPASAPVAITVFNLGAQVGAVLAVAAVTTSAGTLSQFSPNSAPLGTTTVPVVASRLIPSSPAVGTGAVAADAQPISFTLAARATATAPVAVSAFGLSVGSAVTLRPAASTVTGYDFHRLGVASLATATVSVSAYPLSRGIPLGYATVTTEAYTPVVELVFGITQYFHYLDFLEYVRRTVETETGRPAFLSDVTQGLRPEEPFSVIHAFGSTGSLERAFDGQATAISFYLQIDGVGRKYRDALWVLDKAVHAIRFMPCPPRVNDMLIRSRSSAFEIDSEALRAVGQRLAVTATRAPV